MRFGRTISFIVLAALVFILVAEHLVAARFGYTKERNFGIEADVKLIAAAISALR